MSTSSNSFSTRFPIIPNDTQKVVCLQPPIKEKKYRANFFTSPLTLPIPPGIRERFFSPGFFGKKAKLACPQTLNGKILRLWKSYNFWLIHYKFLDKDILRE